MAQAKGMRRDIHRANTIRDIEQAFLQIYAEGGIDRVSVSKICERCHIVRSTFYLYFEDKYSLLQQIEDRLHRELEQICGNFVKTYEPELFTTMAVRVVEHLQQNIDWYRALFGPTGDPVFSQRLKMELELALHRQMGTIDNPSHDAEIRAVFFSSAMLGLYSHIVFNQPSLPKEELSKYMNDFLQYLLVR